MGTRAGFHANDARRQLGDERNQLVTRDLRLDYGVFTLSESVDDERKIDEGDEHHVQNDRNETKIECELSRLVAFIRPVH